MSELCSVLQLPQSTVSRHLKALADSGWVTSRAEGTSRLYSMAPDNRQGPARRLWLLVREQVTEGRVAAQDHRRLQTRAGRAPVALAGVLLVGRRAVGPPARGAVRRALSPAGGLRAAGSGVGRRRPGLRHRRDDRGAGAVCRARDRGRQLGRHAGRRPSAGSPGQDAVEFRRGDLEQLPIADAELDAAVLTLVLPYLPEPSRALADVARVLKPGGRVLITDLLPHDREGYRQQLGHQWLGFSEAQMTSWLTTAGFTDIRLHALPSAPEAKGPGLFVARARRTDRIDRWSSITETRRHRGRSRRSSGLVVRATGSLCVSVSSCLCG